MKLIKHFDFSNANELDLDDWNIQTGEKWSNNELQHYVNKPENLYFKMVLLFKALLRMVFMKVLELTLKESFSLSMGELTLKLNSQKEKGLGLQYG